MMIFLSEYNGPNRVAHVYHRPVTKDFVVIGYEHHTEVISRLISNEDAAEDFAEDWVLQPVSDSTVL